MHMKSHDRQERIKSGMGVSELVDVPEFMRLSGTKKDFAYAIFKNKDLVRKGILVKITPLNKKGGWRIDWEKYMKWARRNAEMTLNV